MLKPRATADPLKRPDAFRKALIDWFGQHGKDYPWRRTEDPYPILVSELMLQQTRLAVVLGKGYYTRFLATFPTVRDLAEADDTRLLKAWEGLGYYRRARLLRDTARAVHQQHDNVFPSELDALLRLPGIGRYTAGAVRSFAFNLPAPIVDGNVARVLSRVFDDATEIDSTAGQRQLWQWAETLVDPKQPRAFNSALMELGQTYCRNGTPDCLECPVAKFCQTREPSALPSKKPRRGTELVTEHAVFSQRQDGAVLLSEQQGRRRQGLWRLPHRTAKQVAKLPLLATRQFTITHHKVTLHIHDCPPEALPGGIAAGEVWQNTEALVSLPMPAPDRKAIDGLLA